MVVTERKGYDHRNHIDRRPIDRYWTSRGAAILNRSSAPLSVISMMGEMSCQRIKLIISHWKTNWFSRDFLLQMSFI